MFDLSDKVAIVTGAASGIGAATAEVLARAGADVVCAWYPGDPHDVEETMRRIEATGRRALAVETDVASSASVDALVSRTVEELGRLDIMVANAGIAPAAPVDGMGDEVWSRVIETNLGGVLRCFRAALPHMRGWGRLLATTSTAGAVQGWADHVPYTATKAGIVGLVRSLALEVGSSGITVNAVAPGVIPTPQSLDAVNSLGPGGVDAFGRRTPVGRAGRAEEIGAAFAFLASPEASYITGQTLVVDGGATLSDGSEHD